MTLHSLLFESLNKDAWECVHRECIGAADSMLHISVVQTHLPRLKVRVTEDIVLMMLQLFCVCITYSSMLYVVLQVHCLTLRCCLLGSAVRRAFDFT